MKKLIRNLSTILLVAPSTFLVSCGEQVESSILDQHVLFSGHYQDGAKLSLSIKSMYDLHSLKYQYTIYDENKILVGTYEESKEVNIPKDKTFSLETEHPNTSNIGAIRFTVLEGKTYDNVDNSRAIEGKSFYYDYLALFNEKFKLQNTEEVQPKQFPKYTFAAKNIGAYSFSSWSTDFYGNYAYSYDEIATKNLTLYPNYVFSEANYKEILKGDNCYNAQFVINREFKANDSEETKKLTGYGTIYKKSGGVTGYNDFYGITTLSFLKKEVEGFTLVNENIHMKKDDYELIVVQEYPEYNLATVRITAKSSKRYFAASVASSSYIHAKTSKIAINEPPYPEVKAESTCVMGNYLGHEEIGEGENKKDYMQYECALGENMEGCAIYDCQGFIAGINTDMYQDGVGYAIPADAIRKALDIIR